MTNNKNWAYGALTMNNADLGDPGQDFGALTNRVQAGLTPLFTDGTACFEQAKLVFVCRRLYQAPLLEAGFHDPEILEENYPLRDLHEMYVGEIIKVYRERE